MGTGVGTGFSIAFSNGSNFSGEVTGATLDGEEVPVIDMAHMGLSPGDYRPKVPGDLIEPPQVTVELNYDPANPPPIRTPATGTLTFPDGTEVEGSGFFASRGAQIPLEDKMTGTFVWQFDGVTGPDITTS